jgi:hypothetical protein
MIVNGLATLAISNVRWLDAGNLWSYALGQSEPRLVPISERKWISLIRGTEDRFAIVQHPQGQGDSARLTAHSFHNVAEAISSIDLPIESINSPGTSNAIRMRITGEGEVWSFLPRVFIIHASEKSVLVIIDLCDKTAQLHALSWHLESYDTMYQGIVGVTEVPGSAALLVSIQRDSEPVFYDPETKKVQNKLRLAGRSGNPELFFRRRAPELWASDYDTLVRLDSRTWKALDSLKLQDGQNGMERLFIGEYQFNNDESLCVVARPYSGDVVGIDPNEFRVILRAETQGQPFEAGIFVDNHIVARDWKTGQLLHGDLRKL